MKLKIGFVIFLTSLMNLNLVAGYKCNFFWNYVCDLHPDSSDIVGQHLPGKSDYNVNEVRINGTIIGIEHLTESDLTPLCDKFKNLQWVLIKGEIKLVSEDLFKNCKGLTGISISETKVEKFPENLFLDNSKLKHLYLEYNKLTELPRNLFSNLSEFEKLGASSNQMQSLPPNIFRSLENLHTLSLSVNKLETLPKNIFKSLINLERLLLWSNQLSTLHADSFGVQRKLKIIDLAYNDISSIDEELIDNTAVEDLNMGRNKCFNGYIRDRREMKEKLQKCFYNYEPREDDFDNTNNCGRRQIMRSTIANGNPIQRGEYPWNAALVLKNGSLFFCGATIISSKFVVTAAHCMKGKHDSHELKPDDFKVLLGVHNISNPSEAGRVSADVISIRIHPDWSTFTSIYEADVAILELKDEIQFNSYIQPICLAGPRSGLYKVSNGTVAGFELDKNHQPLKIARKLNVLIKSYHDCIKNSYDHNYMTSRSFCGKSDDGHGICGGESGSGLYGIKKGRFYLRGIVSYTYLNMYLECDANKDSVFTDALKFYDWIRSGGLKKYA